MRREYGEAALVLVVYGGGIALLVAVVTWWNRWRLSPFREGLHLSVLEGPLEGKVERQASVDMPFIRFRIGEVPCYYMIWAVSPPSIFSLLVLSVVEIRLGAQGFFEALSVDSSRRPTFHPRGVELGGLGDFRLMTTDPQWTMRLLGEGMQRQLLDLAASGLGPIRLQITPTRITLEAERLLESDQALNLVGHARRLVEWFSSHPLLAGTRLLASTFDSETGRCPVCWSPVDRRPTLCGRCRVAYHAECWSYLGRCGIFGCGGRRSG